MIPAAATPDPDEILTLEELSLRLKLSTWTIRRLVKRRVLSTLRTGRTLRFHWPTVKVRLGATLPDPIPNPRGNSFGGPRVTDRFVHP